MQPPSPLAAATNRSVKKTCPSVTASCIGVSAVNYWTLCFRSDRLLEQVSIALVGKYTKLSDSYTSVIKALEHSALAINHKLEVKVFQLSFSLCFSKERVSDTFNRKYHSWLSFHCSSLQYIDSADLESTTLQEEPVKYHEAWQKLCSSQYVSKTGTKISKGLEDLNNFTAAVNANHH